MISKNIINSLSYPLHVAAALGDIAALNRLLLLKPEDIDLRDDLNLTPLQVAAVTGHTEAVNFLIAKGADLLADDGYDQDFSALTLAIWKGYPDIVEILLREQSHGELFDPKEMFFPLLYNLENLFLLIQQPELDPQLLDDALDIFFILTKNEKLALLDFETHEAFYEMFSEPALPALVSLESLTRYAPTKEIYDKIINKIIQMNGQDACYQNYVNAKMLLHVFPIDNPFCKIVYETTQGEPYEHFMNPEGFMACFTTPFVSNEIDCYLNTLNVIESKVYSAFSGISDIYHNAILFSTQQNIFEVSQFALDAYQDGQILLLATGWEGHAVNVILDPIHEYFIVANAGARYENLDSGAYIYKIYNPENLTAELIFEVLNNTEEVDLELSYKYELALDKVDFLKYPEQEYGNCAFYSHKPAIEALLYLNHLNDFNPLDSKLLAHQEYVNWEEYENLHCLHTYFDNNPKLDIHTVLDILVDYHPSLFKDNEQAINITEYHQAQYLVEVLATQQYKNDFALFSSTLPEAKPELIDLFKSVDLPLYFDENRNELMDFADIFSPYQFTFVVNELINFDVINPLDGFCLQQMQAL